MQNPDTVPVLDAILALAFIGDLSMGRPTDHSLRTAWLAAQLAERAGCGAQDCRAARQVALLRWSGCTANAAGFEALLGDDVGGREALMSQTLPALSQAQQRGIFPLAEIHCEVSGEIAAMLGMGNAVEQGLRNIFETYDGTGMPGRLRHPAVPELVYHVTLASDLEILGRVHGLEGALARIAAAGNRKYPDALVGPLRRHARDWLAALDEQAPAGGGMPAARGEEDVPLTVIADVIDLKLPWMAGYSRQVAELARASAALQGLDAVLQARLHRAGLIHGMGRAALPNRLWNTPGRLPAADWERIRLVPYWTSRAARQIGTLGAEAELASYAYERLDGSGYFRGLGGDALSAAHRTLAVAAAWAALRARRPWREAMAPDAAAALLREEAARGRFDADAVEATLAAAGGRQAPAAPRTAVVLSERETDVLRRISQGESNKEVARTLSISPSTVRTHVESIFRKLECSTRAAATLKAFTLGLL
ncbi:HD domain-containing phosphohydrolase [Cupriavidus sp. 30B13]|uniref:HD domain-containing phosphohydrolase n=1 Tax=Cupriavidus sp. 30B13 TaxID=3384241 RepID=UPI003B9123B5